jgi:hypothetical protein
MREVKKKRARAPGRRFAPGDVPYLFVFLGLFGPPMIING